MFVVLLLLVCTVSAPFVCADACIPQEEAFTITVFLAVATALLFIKWWLLYRRSE